MKTISNNDKITVWCLFSVIAFAALGVAAAKVQYGIEGNTDAGAAIISALSGYSQQYAITIGGASIPIAQSQQELHMIITYGLVGAALGLIVGLFNVYFRQRGRIS